MYIMTDRHFDSKASANSDRGNTGSDGWDGIEYRYGGFSIVADPTAPTGDGRVGQMFYPAQHKAGTGPATAQTMPLSNGPKQLYVSVWVKISSNWVGNQSSTNKIFFLGVAGGNNQFFMSAEGSGHNTLVPQIRLQGVVDPRPRVAPNVTNATMTRGAWHRWELVLTCNSGLNVPDGTIDLWQDGKHITSVKNVNWMRAKAPTQHCGFSIFNWNPTYGGGGASPGVDQYLWFDRVYMSGR